MLSQRGIHLYFAVSNNLDGMRSVACARYLFFHRVQTVQTVCKIAGCSKAVRGPGPRNVGEFAN